VGGVARIKREGYPDHTSWDASSKYHDPKSTPDNPRWFMVDLDPVTALKPVTLPDMRANPALEGMLLLRKGQRLSVQTVEQAHFEAVLAMAGMTLDDVAMS